MPLLPAPSPTRWPRCHHSSVPDTHPFFALLRARFGLLSVWFPELRTSPHWPSDARPLTAWLPPGGERWTKKRAGEQRRGLSLAGWTSVASGRGSKNIGTGRNLQEVQQKCGRQECSLSEAFGREGQKLQTGGPYMTCRGVRSADTLPKIHLDRLSNLNSQGCPISLEKLETCWCEAGMPALGPLAGADWLLLVEGAHALWSPAAPPAPRSLVACLTLVDIDL